MLVEMDGFEGNEGVIVIAATNRPQDLDAALTSRLRAELRPWLAAAKHVVLSNWQDPVDVTMSVRPASASRIGR